MSVIGFGSEEIGVVARHVMNNKDLIGAMMLEDDKKDLTGADHKSIMVQAFVFQFFNRIYIANQLAYKIQYEEEREDKNKITVDMLTEDDLTFDKKTMDYSKLAQKMGLFHYNVYTNAGRALFHQEDEMRLEKLYNYLVGEN